MSKALVMLDFKIGKLHYPVIIQENCLNVNTFAPYIQNKKVAIVCDENVRSLYGETLVHILNAELITVPSGEDSKSLEHVAEICSTLAQLTFTRSDLLIALGGGVIGDLAGFCASIYLRGIDYFQVPTTLLAQIDSSMGGKTGVNLKEGKNLVGSFHHPKAVLIDPTVLQSLPESDFIDGLAEMIKYGFIFDESILQNLENHTTMSDIKANIIPLIRKCCIAKKSIVENDEKDTGLRMTLNFGHTLGHAIEKAFGLSHGCSIALGMVMISELALKKGLIGQEIIPRMTALLQKCGLPIDTSPYPLEKLLPFVSVDKKNINSSLKLILTPEAGKSIIISSDLSFFKENL